MKELINLIPENVAGCRELIKKIKGAKGKGIEVTDRRFNTETLTPEEAEELLSLVESQIAGISPVEEREEGEPTDEPSKAQKGEDGAENSGKPKKKASK